MAYVTIEPQKLRNMLITITRSEKTSIKAVALINAWAIILPQYLIQQLSTYQCKLFGILQEATAMHKKSAKRYNPTKENDKELKGGLVKFMHKPLKALLQTLNIVIKDTIQ
eukprot:TRINITY_DN22948_c0_g2_i2.p7 TRINITY_DN22948_c0_g2~~TRINITY_DN22948_c0_g2_i2.p7  ORF type:complete len:111 (+),score=1.41 TRINITY_DN22948_c0_g2_i2:941-1273(+)